MHYVGDPRIAQQNFLFYFGENKTNTIQTRNIKIFQGVFVDI